MGHKGSPRLIWQHFNEPEYTASKMPKATTPKASHGRRHNPLEDDLLATGLLKNKTGKSKREAAEPEEQSYVDAKASRQILAMSRSLIDEDQQENAKKNAVAGPSAFDFDPSRFGAEDDQDEEYGNAEDAWGDEDDIVEEIEVDAEDLETFNRFVAPTMKEDPLLTHGWDGKQGDESVEEEGQGTNLADLILAKIAERESAMQGGAVEEEIRPVDEDYELPPKVVEVYTK